MPRPKTYIRLEGDVTDYAGDPHELLSDLKQGTIQLDDVFDTSMDKLSIVTEEADDN